MIPREVYYFWFSNEQYPRKIQLCLNSWKDTLVSYELIKKDLTNTEVTHPYAQKALSEKKWAFLTDFCRLKTIYENGGIYMDTDVIVLKQFDDLLSYDAFFGRADNGMIEPVVFGAKKGHPIVKECLDILSSQDIDDPNFEYVEIPLVIEQVFFKYGFDKSNKNTQHLKDTNTFIGTFDYFCPLPFNEADNPNYKKFATENTYAIHLWNAEWFDPFRFFWSGRRKAGWKAIWRTIRSNPLQPVKFYRNVFYYLKEEIKLTLKSH